MRPLKKRVSIVVDREIYEEIKILAENSDRSLSQYINMILKEHLTGKKQKDILIK